VGYKLSAMDDPSSVSALLELWNGEAGYATSSRCGCRVGDGSLPAVLARRDRDARSERQRSAPGAVVPTLAIPV